MQAGDVATRKQNWRRVSLAKRAARRAADRHGRRSRSGLSPEVLQVLTDELPIGPEAVLAGFLPLPSEVDVRPLLREWSGQVGTVYVPTDEALKSSGRAEPRWRAVGGGKATLPTAAVQADVLLVPGLAFDRSGRRIGRGAGWYDRVLAEIGGSAIRVGVCFPEDVLRSGVLPTESFDQPVHALLTTDGLRLL